MMWHFEKKAGAGKGKAFARPNKLPVATSLIPNPRVSMSLSGWIYFRLINPAYHFDLPMQDWKSCSIPA